MRVLALLVVAVLAAGCRYGGTFMCDTNSDCGAGGSCQAAQYCSFGDTGCVSGQRYDVTAGPYAGVCVGEEMGNDASIFDPSVCPASYAITIASSPSSRYFIRTALTSYWMHHQGCKGDLVGATHLLLPDSAMELSEIIVATANVAVGENEFFIGAAQNIADASSPSTGWTRVDGNALAPALWLSNEPNDVDGSEADHESNVAALVRASHLLDDVRGVTLSSPALCECDGRAVPASVESILAGDPNHD